MTATENELYETSSAGLNLLLVAVVCQAVKDARRGNYRAARWLRDEGLDVLETLGHGSLRRTIMAEIAPSAEKLTWP